MFTIQHLYIKVLSRTSVPLVCTTLDAIWELPNRINSTTPFWINYFPKMLTSAYSLLPLQGKAIKQSMECPLCTCRDISSYCTNSHPMNILSIGLLDYLRPNLRRKAPPVQKVGSVVKGQEWSITHKDTRGLGKAFTGKLSTNLIGYYAPYTACTY